MEPYGALWSLMDDIRFLRSWLRLGKGLQPRPKCILWTLMTLALKGLIRPCHVFCFFCFVFLRAFKGPWGPYKALRGLTKHLRPYKALRGLIKPLGPHKALKRVIRPLRALQGPKGLIRPVSAL